MEQNASVTELSLVIIKRARYNELIKKKISSGQGVIPYRRYSPRPMETWLNRCDSGTDSIVWMREERAVFKERAQCPGKKLPGLFM